MEHRLVMEAHLGRYLSKDEVVHHKDGDTLNNHINNLAVVDRVAHYRAHWEQGKKSRWHGKNPSPDEVNRALGLCL